MGPTWALLVLAGIIGVTNALRFAFWLSDRRRTSIHSHPETEADRG